MTHHNDVHGKPIIQEMVNLVETFETAGRFDSLRNIMEFEGPYTSKIGDVPYISFNQYGPREEGASVYRDESQRCWTEAEAMWRFRRTFIEYLVEHPAKQLAWRCKPRVTATPDGDFIVRCRFALLGPCSTALQAVA